MKAYTDLEQSKKLAEFLPLESADMCFNISVRKNIPPLMVSYSKFDEFFSISPTPDFLIPCWSLAALLELMPRIEHLKPIIDLSPKLDSEGVSIYYHSEDSPYIVKDNLIDACYEMILKLHELNLL